jgi:adenylate cyclase
VKAERLAVDRSAHRERSFLAELKRRKVFRAAAAYAVVAWLALQLADILVDNLEAPPWVFRWVLACLVLGFPLVLLLAWAYELRPESPVPGQESPGTEEAQAGANRRFYWLIAAGVLAALGLMVFQLAWLAGTPQIRPGSSIATAPGVPIASDAAGVSIAVLPFVNLSEDPANEYFVDGLSEELRNVLSQAPTLLVVGRTSSFAWKESSEDLRSIGVRLGVSHILEGSVRRQGDRVRVTAQLLRAEDGFHLWSQNYDRLLDDVFEIQDDIAGNVLHALEVVLDEDQQRRMRNAGIRNVEAFIAYQQGLDLYVQAHAELPLVPTLRRANALFDQAVALAPEFSAAHYLKSDLHAHVLAFERATDEERIDALAQLRAALAAAHDSARDPMRRALIDLDRVLFSDDWSALPDRIDRVLAQRGCPDPVWLGAVVFLADAAPLAELYHRQVSCEPLDVTAWNGLVLLSLRSDGPELALRRLDEAGAALGRGDRRLAGAEVVTLLALGRVAEAVAAAGRVPPEEEYFGVVAGPLTLAARGRTDDALAALETRRAAAAQPDAGLTLWVYAAAGQRQRANDLAARMDAWPAGPLLLATVITYCMCGAPFDLEVTPRLRRRLEEAGAEWPPATLIRYPAKDW